MACTNEIHVGDIGTEFIVTLTECDSTGATVPVDVSSATSKQFKIFNPDQTVLTVNASFTSIGSGGTGDGTDGKLSYFTVSGDLDQAGKYKIQAIVAFSSGTWSSTIQSFRVKENL